MEEGMPVYPLEKLLPPEDFALVQRLALAIRTFQRIPSIGLVLDYEPRIPKARAMGLWENSPQARDFLANEMVQRTRAMANWCFFNDYMVSKSQAPTEVRKEVCLRFEKIAIDAIGMHGCKNDSELASKLGVDVNYVADFRKGDVEASGRVSQRMILAGGNISDKPKKVKMEEAREDNGKGGAGRKKQRRKADGIAKEAQMALETVSAEIEGVDSGDHQEVAGILEGINTEIVRMQENGGCNGNGTANLAADKRDSEMVSQMKGVIRRSGGFSGRNSGYDKMRGKSMELIGEGIEKHREGKGKAEESGKGVSPGKENGTRKRKKSGLDWSNRKLRVTCDQNKAERENAQGGQAKKALLPVK